MIYMVADDPKGGAMLDAEANLELDAIIGAVLGVNEEIRKNLHVAVQIDFRSQPDVWRRIIGESTWTAPETNAADPNTLYGFFEFVARECPAQRNLLMFWGHSRGPFGLFSDEDPYTYVAQTLTLPELHRALKAATDCLDREVDIITFKDCFMSTLETAYELHDRATYVLASQDIVPIRGWPYAEMFASLVANDDPELAAKAIFDNIDAYYGKKENRGGRKAVPFSLIDTKNILALHDPLRQLVAAFSKNGNVNGNGARPKMNIPKTTFSGTTPGDPALVDLVALCRKLQRSQRDAVREAAADLLTKLKKVVLRPAIASTNGPAQTQGRRPHQTRPRPAARRRPFGGISAFVNPLGTRKRSNITPLASVSTYSSLAVTRTGWNNFALRGVRNVPAVSGHSYQSYPENGNGYGSAVLFPFLEYLQRHGVLEELQRKGMTVLRQTLGELANGVFAGASKGQGFAEGSKGQGFAEGSKGQGFAGASKGQGFAEGSKGQGFAAGS